MEDGATKFKWNLRKIGNVVKSVNRHNGQSEDEAKTKNTRQGQARTRRI